MFDKAPKARYNARMKNEKNIDCNGDSWHLEAEDSNGITVWVAWRVTFNGHQKNLSWHCSEEDAQAFIDAGIAQAKRRSEEMAAEQRSAYEQNLADMAELRGPRGWV